MDAIRWVVSVDRTLNNISNVGVLAGKHFFLNDVETVINQIWWRHPVWVGLRRQFSVIFFLFFLFPPIMHRAYQPLTPANNIFLRKRWDQAHFEMHRQKRENGELKLEYYHNLFLYNNHHQVLIMHHMIVLITSNLGFCEIGDFHLYPFTNLSLLWCNSAWQVWEAWPWQSGNCWRSRIKAYSTASGNLKKYNEEQPAPSIPSIRVPYFVSNTCSVIFTLHRPKWSALQSFNCIMLEPMSRWSGTGVINHFLWCP